MVGAGLVLSSGLMAAGPVSLFDGKTFEGWNGDTNGTWRISGGVIEGGSLEKTVPKNEFLATNRGYTNFVLRLKFQLVGSEGFVNSGVQIRSGRIPNHHEMIGYQADIGPDWYGCLYDESRRNTVLARPAADSVRNAVKVGEWNQYEIRCEGARVQTWINGVAMIDYTEKDPKIAPHGVLGMQVHGGGKAVARFKEIEIEELPQGPR